MIFVVNLGKDRFSLLESSISLLERAVIGQKPSNSEVKSPEAATSSSGTLTPQTRRAHRHQSSSTSSSGSRHQHHHHRRRSHRIYTTTSSLVVTSTPATDAVTGTASQTSHIISPASQVQHPPIFVSSSIFPSGERVTTDTASTSIARRSVRLRNTFVQSSPMYHIGYYSSSSSTDDGHSQTFSSIPWSIWQPIETHQSRVTASTLGVPSLSSAPTIIASSHHTAPIVGGETCGGMDEVSDVGSEFAGFFHPALLLL